jgi:predicted membrane protein
MDCNLFLISWLFLVVGLIIMAIEKVNYLYEGFRIFKGFLFLIAHFMVTLFMFIAISIFLAQLDSTTGYGVPHPEHQRILQKSLDAPPDF